MKKRNTLGLCILLLAMLTACGQEKNMEQATKKDPAAADTEADAEEVSGTAAVHRKMEGEFISLWMMAQP